MSPGFLKPIENYCETLTGSAAFMKRAEASLAGASAHDSWHLAPFAPAFVSADGAYKTDIDGRQYVDLWMGHGSLLLGHGNRQVVEAAESQLAQGTHFSGLTPMMVEWAESVRNLIPSADMVRFTASGSEACHLAVRVARASTGRSVIIRLGGHYHGWHENLLSGVAPPSSIGKTGEDAIEVWGHDDFEGIEQRLETGDVAAMLLEPGGGGSGALEWSASALERFRRICDQTGTLLVFDEVISGFRYAPGGVQALSGVTPDLTMLAKILAGGWPGGALVGKGEVMSVFSSKPVGSAAKVIHAGTFNAFAVSAAAGIATLRQIADGAAQKKAEENAEVLVGRVNAAAQKIGLDAGMFRNSSTVHLVLGAQEAGVELKPSAEAFQLIARNRASYVHLRRMLLVEGLDMHTTHGWVSAVHDEAVIERAADAFSAAFANMIGSLNVQTLAECGSQCHDPTCGARRRAFAGCDLPLANPVR